MRSREPQSTQSVPNSHIDPKAPQPPSWQTASPAVPQVSRQIIGGGKTGGGGEGGGLRGGRLGGGAGGGEGGGGGKGEGGGGEGGGIIGGIGGNVGGGGASGAGGGGIGQSQTHWPCVLQSTPSS